MGRFVRQIFRLIIGLVAAFMVISNVSAETSLDAKTILERCEKEGAAHVIDDLSLGEDWERWDEVTDKIATGTSIPYPESGLDTNKNAYWRCL